MSTLFRRVEEQETTARDFGFYWKHINQLIDQIKSECQEVVEARESGNIPHLQEELGDLIHAAISLAVYCNIDPETALRQSTEKFQKRYDLVVAYAKKEGHITLHNQSFEVLMSYWDRAKKQP